MGDFSIDLLKTETCDFSHNFLLSLQSYSFFPTIDKPTRVYNNSATLINKIFVNRIDSKFSSGNSVSDINDYYSQFALFHSPGKKTHLKKPKIRDYSHFVRDAFNMELLQIDWKTSSSVDESFAQFYNKSNNLINAETCASNKLSQVNNLSNLQHRGLQVVCEIQLKLRIRYSHLGTRRNTNIVETKSQA